MVRSEDEEMERYADHVDALVVGAGPAGLSAAIRLKQLFDEAGESERRVCVLEKGAEVGAHILSGNCFEPHALDELLPEWRSMDAPITTAVTQDKFVFLTDSGSFRLPTPPQMHNDGNYIISLGKLTRWLGEQAEMMGIEIYPGYAGAEVLRREDGSVMGIATNEVGVAKDGSRKPTYDPGMELHAPITLFAEGCRGSLTLKMMDEFALTEGVAPQTYGIGIKELWEIDPEKHTPGLVMHTVGWPVDTSTYGGSFLYHLEDNKVAVGYVVGLDYKNPYLNPYKEFQRWKHHPAIAPTFEGGTCLEYGARALNEGGYQSIPKLTFPGGALVGCAAGFLNVPKIKGTHTAMKSGMVAAEAAAKQLIGGPEADGSFSIDIPDYQTNLENSWVYEELKKVRNVRPSFQYGLWAGMAISALETVTMGLLPWTLTMPHKDHETCLPADQCEPIEYPKPDGVLSFDLATNVSRSSTNHEEDQPVHLEITDEKGLLDVSLGKLGGPEQNFCPAGVYSYEVDEDGNPYLGRTAIACVHCRTCSIKSEPYITWNVPEGGGGPLYSQM